MSTTTAISNWRQQESCSDDEQVEIEPPFANYSGSDIGHITDTESGQHVGSTSAAALNPAVQYSLPETSDHSSDVTPVRVSAEPKIHPLGGSSRALVKELFGTIEPDKLPSNYPVNVFTEGQICRVLRVVADETVRASSDMLENLLYRASQISLSSGPDADSGKIRAAARRGSSVVTSSGRYPESTAGGCTDTSGVLRSDDNFASIGYSNEPSEPGLITVRSRASRSSSSQMDPGSPFPTSSIDSPGAQTLAALKKEAIHDRQHKARNQKCRFTASSSKTHRARRGVSRTCKVVKEAYFRCMECTRTFVLGPVDPK